MRTAGSCSATPAVASRRSWPVMWTPPVWHPRARADPTPHEQPAPEPAPGPGPHGGPRGFAGGGGRRALDAVPLAPGGAAREALEVQHRDHPRDGHRLGDLAARAHRSHPPHRGHGGGALAVRSVQRALQAHVHPRAGPRAAGGVLAGVVVRDARPAPARAPLGPVAGGRLHRVVCRGRRGSVLLCGAARGPGAGAVPGAGCGDADPARLAARLHVQPGTRLRDPHAAPDGDAGAHRGRGRDPRVPAPAVAVRAGGDLRPHRAHHARRRGERTVRDGGPHGAAVLRERGPVVPRGAPARGERAAGGAAMSARAKPPAAPAAPAARRERAASAGPAMPLLAVDVGNTDTVVGRFRGGELEASWRVTTDRSTADEVRLLLDGLLRTGASGAASVLCSVVPALTRPWVDALRASTGREPLEVSAADSPIPLQVPDPDSVGADRIANAMAGKALHGAPCIVVDMGTATTFDCVSKQGAFVGGAIAPGMRTASDDLFRRAARLSSVELRRPERAVANTTA